jgi:hypothetical protein
MSNLQLVFFPACSEGKVDVEGEIGFESESDAHFLSDCVEHCIVLLADNEYSFYSTYIYSTYGTLGFRTFLFQLYEKMYAGLSDEPELAVDPFELANCTILFFFFIFGFSFISFFLS